MYVSIRNVFNFILFLKAITFECEFPFSTYQSLNGTKINNQKLNGGEEKGTSEREYECEHEVVCFVVCVKACE